MTAIALNNEQLASAKATARELGAAIRAARIACGQTIEQLALSRDSHPTTVSLIERGESHNVKLSSVIKLLGASNLTLEVRKAE